MVIPFNNVGDLYNKGTLGYVKAFAESKCNMGVETFELWLDLRNYTNRIRFDLLSYADESDRFRLKKTAYGFRPADPESPHIRWSSNTWYFKVSQLDSLAGLHPSYLFVVGKPSPPDGEMEVKRDLDQLTHSGEQGCVAEVHHPRQKAVEGFYSHARFMVVRTEDNIRAEEFRLAFGEWSSKFVGDDFKGDIVALKDRPFFVLSAIPQTNVWGGRRLCKEEDDLDTGEIWLGVHPAGTALIHLNRHVTVPFNAVCPDFRFMIKYLDCQKALSIQVHPDELTARAMRRLDSKQDPEPLMAKAEEQRFQLKDHLGKEESFLVLSPAAGRDYHLFYGFERGKLHPLAKQIRRVLENHASKKDPLTQSDTRETFETCFLDVLEEIRKFITDAAWKEIQTHLHNNDWTPAEDRPPSATPALDQTTEDEIKQLNERVIESFSQDKGGRQLCRIFGYHVRRAYTEGGDAEKRYALLGHEYVFAAIAVIWLIKEIKEYLNPPPRNEKADGPDSNTTQSQGASEDKQKPTPAKGLSEGMRKRGESLFKLGSPNSPLLGYFHSEKAVADSWGRVPPGTVHAWRGGGNFLIELSNQSDTTFRILDFGRELDPNTRREMHYIEAMYALRPTTIVGDAVDGRPTAGREEASALRSRIFFKATALGSAAGSGAETSARKIPAALEREVHRDLTSQPDLEPDGTGKIELTRASGAEWSMILNPDNPMRVYAEGEGEQIVDTYGGVYVNEKKAKSVTIIPRQASDRILRILPRAQSHEEIVCVSLGTSKIETALFRDLDCLWIRTSKVPAKDKDNADRLQSACDEVRQQLGNLRPSKLVVSWPGYYDSKKDKFYSTGYGSYKRAKLKEIWNLGENVEVVNDALLSACGEAEHRLGAFASAESAMVLNVGSGLCAGLYMPQWERASTFHPDVVACCALGRWLAVEQFKGTVGLFASGTEGISPLSGSNHTYVVPPHFFEKITSLVFKDQPEEQSGRWHRGSKWWETDAIVRRGMELVGDQSPENDTSVGKVLKLNQLAASAEYEAKLRPFMISIGNELAEVVRILRSALQSLRNRDRDRFPNAAAATRRVVLTGTIGRLFGWIDAEDVLVDAMTGNLGSSTDVRRSEIVHAAEREAAGFEYYVRRYSSDPAARSSE
jgi:hypothetical protein